MANLQISHLKQGTTTYDIKDVTTDNVRGSGTSGNLVKWGANNTATEGPTISSSGSATKFLNEKGEWATPSGTFSLSVATNTVVGGVKPWYYHSAASTGPTAGSDSTAITVNAKSTTSLRYYAIESDVNGRMFVNVPWQNNTDTKVNVKARGTTKAYLLATSTEPTSSDQAVTSLAETAVYLDTTAGKLVATSFSGNGSALTSLNANNIGSGTVPIARLPVGTTSTTVAYGNHTHTASIAQEGSSGTSLSRNTWYTLTAGGSTVTFKLPASDNTDTKVAVAALTDTTSTVYHPILAKDGATSAATRQIDTTGAFNYAVKLGTTSSPGTADLHIGNLTGSGTANNVEGSITICGSSIYSTTIKHCIASATGTAYLPQFTSGTNGVTTVYLVGTTASGTKGSTIKPVYISSGIVDECLPYAGGTAVTLNGTSKVATTASFFAPTEGDTAGKLLVAQGTSDAPVWKSQSLAYSLAQTSSENDTLVLPTSVTLS